MQLLNPENVIQETKRFIQSNKRSEIRLNSNGGNSILIVCEPKDEQSYINVINKELPAENYEIIDLSKLLCEFVENNRELIVDSFELLKGSVEQIFKAPAGEDSPDLFSLIIQYISDSFKNNKIPVLINTGSLYGSGIENINLMEHEQVIKANLPLIILYPATHIQDRLMFLGKRPASKYRCMIIQ